MLSNFVVVHCGRFIYLFLCVVPLHPQKCSTSEDALLPLGGVGYVRSQDCECSSGCDRSTRDAVTGHYMWITSSEGGQPPHRLLGLPSYQSLHLHQNNRSSDRTDSSWSQICASMGVTLLKDKKTLLRGELHHEISSHGRSVLALSL